jgi:hypothetical protein
MVGAKLRNRNLSGEDRICTFGTGHSRGFTGTGLGALNKSVLGT